MMCRGWCGRCICNGQDDHEGPHTCDCGGSWSDDGTVHSWPQVDPNTGRTVALMADADPVLKDLLESRPELPWRDPAMPRGYR